MAEAVNPALFRQVLGQYPTGVVVITALSPEGEPLGMTVGSFTSVSLEPPLVAFLPDKKSSSWRSLRESGTAFGVNVLAADQETVCREVAVRKSRKFDGMSWRRSEHGNPILTGCVAFIDCETENIVDAGDHQIVVGRVESASIQRPTNPLLFYRGGYGSFRPRSLAAGASGIHDQLRFVDVARPIMERFAAEMDSEVIALVLADGELVTAAAAGRSKSFLGPSRVGQRAPFVPPIGAVHATWGGEKAREYWLAQIPDDAPAGERERYEQMPEQIRERGYGFALGHDVGAAIELMAMRQSHDRLGVSEDEFRHVIGRAGESYNPVGLDPLRNCEFHAATAPVFHPNAELAFTLTLWGPPGEISYPSMMSKIDGLVTAARLCSEALAYAEAGD